MRKCLALPHFLILYIKALANAAFENRFVLFHNTNFIDFLCPFVYIYFRYLYLFLEVQDAV